MIEIKNKNSEFQSCRYCFVGVGFYRLDSDEGAFYVCEKHRQEKDFIKDLPLVGIEEEFFIEKVGLIQRALNYIKGI